MELPRDSSAVSSASATASVTTARTHGFVSRLVRGSTQAIHSIRDDVLDTDSDRRLPPLCLSRPLFWVAWLSMFVLQIAVVLFMLVFVIIYYRLAQPRAESVRVVYYLPSIAALRAIAIISLLVVCLYVLNLKRMISSSLDAGRLTFWRMPLKLPPDSGSDDDSEDEDTNTGRCASARRTVAHAWPSLWLSYRTIFGRRGLFGIENRYFDQVLILREGVEIASQSHQSYRMSQFVGISSVNSLSCLLLVLNCWSTPLVHLVIRKNTSAQRVTCLGIDVLFQFVWAVAIPIKIMLPFIHVFDKTTQRFPEVNAADNVFMLNWEMHSQQVLASSVVDFLSKLTPTISILAACRGIGSMLEERAAVMTSIVPEAAHHDDKAGTKTRQPVTTEREFWLRWSHHKMTRTERLAHALYAFWGFVVVGNRVHSTRVAQRGASQFCLVELQPWFTTPYSCALVEIDCFRTAKRLGLTTASAVEDHTQGFLAGLNPDAVSFLAFVHCPALKIPNSLATLSNLRGLEVYNSSILQWDLQKAALSQQNHPILRRVSLVRTPLIDIPGFLLVADLPRSLVLLNLVATGLKTLPDTVTFTWRHVKYFVLEHSPLDGVPVALTRMALGRLGLVNSNLTSLPDFPLAEFEHFAVGRNPITELPTNIGDLATIAWVSFDNTAVASLPVWMARLRDDGVLLFGEHAPYCSTSDPVVDCSMANPRAGGMYPLREETERRNADFLGL